MSAAIVYPGADYRQLAGKSEVLLTPLVIDIHTMVGTLAGTESWFTPAGQAYSHFGLGATGAVRQWQDLRFRAASDLEGNPFCISIECEDTGVNFLPWTGSNVPFFTDKQLVALDKLVSWLCARFSIKRQVLHDSCSRDGISYHRLGIDPWRGSNCTKFSKSLGKACPGDNRIEDIKKLFGVPATREWDEMATKDEVKAALRDVLNEGTARGQSNWAGTSKAILGGIQANANKLNALAKAVSALDAVDEAELAALILTVLTPAAIAEALDDSIAQEVIDLLREKLAT
jgi:hypothetical protein